MSPKVRLVGAYLLGYEHEKKIQSWEKGHRRPSGLPDPSSFDFSMLIPARPLLASLIYIG
jgi:hypothetical protein